MYLMVLHNMLVISIHYLIIDHTFFNSSWFRGWLQWSPSSVTMLRAAEKKILSCKYNLMRKSIFTVVMEDKDVL
jgi:hypothetical protein